MTAMQSRRHRKRKLKAEINVVPYIDVMLVLLIIFMVTAPLLNLGVDIELPQSNASPIEQKKERHRSGSRWCLRCLGSLGSLGCQGSLGCLWCLGCRCGCRRRLGRLLWRRGIRARERLRRLRVRQRRRQTHCHDQAIAQHGIIIGPQPLMTSRP